MCLIFGAKDERKYFRLLFISMVGKYIYFKH